MHILLTDILTCPRCGPQFGLILLAHRIEARRVLDGVLGCANCREQYRVVDGAGEFGGDTRLPAPDGAGDVMRVAALLGITEGRGFVLLAGPVAAHAPAIAELLPGLEVIACAYGAHAGAVTAESPGVNRVGAAGPTLPFANAKVNGVALSGAAAHALLEEGARVVSPVGRIVVADAPADAAARLQAKGLRILAQDGATVVAGRV